MVWNTNNAAAITTLASKIAKRSSFIVPIRILERAKLRTLLCINDQFILNI